MNEQLLKAANAIGDEDLKKNALALIEAMDTVQEGIGDEIIRWRPKFIRVVQPTTDTDAIDGNAKPGAIVVGDTVADKGVDLYVLRVWDSRAMWNPDLSIKQIVCQSVDAKTGWRYGDCRSCEHQKFVDGKPSPCKKQKSFLAITKDLKNVVKLDLSRSQYSVGTEWEGKIKGTTSRPPFLRIFHIGSRKADKGKANFSIDPVRMDEYADGDVAEFLTTLFQHFRAARTEEIARFYESIKRYKEKQEAAKAAGGDIGDDVPGTIDVSVDNGGGDGAQSGGDTPNYTL